MFLLLIFKTDLAFFNNLCYNEEERGMLMNRIYFEEFRRRVTDSEPYAVFHRTDVNYVAHIHEEIEVGYLRSGTLVATTEEGDVRLAAGDLFAFMPDEIHALSSNAPNEAVILRILPKQTERVDFSSFRLKNKRISLGDLGYEALKGAVLQMEAEFFGDAEGREMALRKCRYDIFLTLLRMFERTPVPDTEKQRLASHTLLLRRVNDYICEHYGESVSLDEIASHCGYSKYYFAHCMREITGTTFLEFLMLYRLSLACERLKSRDGSVTEIAFDCGFNSLRSFNRMFQKYYHTTPSAYRKEFS